MLNALSGMYIITIIILILAKGSKSREIFSHKKLKFSIYVVHLKKLTVRSDLIFQQNLGKSETL